MAAAGKAYQPFLIRLLCNYSLAQLPWPVLLITADLATQVSHLRQYIMDAAVKSFGLDNGQCTQLPALRTGNPLNNLSMAIATFFLPCEMRIELYSVSSHS
jgi:hypothetical protein